MIENSDRGITLNKSLAWTIGVSLVAGGLWIGIQVTTLAGSIQTMSSQHMDLARTVDERHRALETRQAEDRVDLRAQAREITAMQTQNALIEQKLTNIESTSRRTADSLAELRRELRDFMARGSVPAN